MPKRFFLTYPPFIIFVLLLYSEITFSQTCNNWLRLPSQPSFVRVGDLDIPGNKITVEAEFNRTAPWSGTDVWQGDLVSKHEGPSDCNYLLRPSSAEITTTNGYFKTPTICPIQLNKRYHAAMVYDGTTLKFYRNGFLMSQIAATGNLFQNNWQTQFGFFYAQALQENFLGYINEVRIWNIARTQTEIRANMNQSLPSPQTQAGLLAYYTFDNLLNKQGNATWNGTLGGNASINATNPVCNIVVDSCNVVVTPNNPTSCSGFQIALGGNSADRAYDIAPTTNNQFYVAGTSSSYGNGEQVLVSKLTETGNVLWSKTFGGSNTESVRKITSTADGGLLVIGQTKSYGNANGDILCMKIDGTGNLLWSRKFGVGSPAGDLGMDIIETTDGGYALSGIINVNGIQADYVVMKLDNAANVTWSKRYNRNDGEDGVGLIQKGDTLIAACDLMNNGSHYEFQVMKLKLSDGSFIMSKKFKPSARGLFNPYIFKNPTQPGYIISGHTVEYDTYAYMRHTLIYLNENLDLIQTKLISVSPQTNDFFTGFFPMADGSFIGCATPQNNPDGYFYRINADNTISYSKRFNSTDARRLYRLTVSNNKVFAVGGAVQGGQEDFFITSFDANGNTSASCDVENVNLVVEQPTYTASAFTWLSIIDLNFVNTVISVGNSFVNLKLTSLCNNNFPIDFGFQQNLCSPKTITFSTTLTGAQSFQWHFGDGQTNNNSLNPTVTYDNIGTYDVKLIVQYNGGCIDSITKSIIVDAIFDNSIILNVDTSICKGDSILLVSNATTNFCWSSTNGTPPTVLNEYVSPNTTTTYLITTQETGNNLVINADFSAGNTGFTSQYNYAIPNLTEGQFWVGNNPASWNGGMSACGDHTTGTGRMLCVNGSPTPNAKVWSQTVTVIPNTNYNFSVWIAALYPPNPANLRFSINNVLIGNNILASSPCQWNQFYSSWNSGSSTTATITIVNNNTIAEGNDFALDDIFFGPVITKTDSFTVIVVPPPTQTPTQSFSSCNGSIKIGSGVIPATYVWSTGETTDSVIVNSSGIYWVESNRNGCMVRDSFQVDIAANIPIDFGFQQDLCNPKTIQFSTTLNGAQSYQWDFGNGQTNNNSLSPTITYDNLGNYEIKLVVEAGTNCKDSIIKTITVDAIYDNSIIINSDTTICSGDSILITSNVNSNFCWNSSTGTPPDVLNSYITPTANTTYAITTQEIGNNLVVNSDFSSGNTGFTSDYSYAVTNVTEEQYWVGVNPSLWNGGMSNCVDHTTGSGGMLLVNGAPTPNSKVWSQTVSVTPNTTYNFSVWIASLYPPNPANLKFSVNNVIIGNNILASSPCQWNQFYSSWNSGSSTTATITIVNNNTVVEGNDFALDDIFFGTVTTKTDSFTVTVSPSPEVSLNNDTVICKGVSVQLAANTSSGSNITWSPGIYLNNATITNPVSTPDNTLTYFAEVVNSSGCIRKDSITITVFEEPVIILQSDTAICSGVPLILTSSTSNATFFNWHPTTGLSNSSIANPIASPTTTTLYTLTASNAGGCSDSKSINVIVNHLPDVTISSASTICEGTQVPLTATGGISYVWTPSTGLSNSNVSNPVAQPTETIMYKVGVTGANGCNNLDSVLVSVKPKPVFSLHPQVQSVCLGESATITASGGDTYTWVNTGSNTDFINVNPTGTTNYTVYIKDLTCDVTDTLSATIQVNQLPSVIISKSNDIDCSSFQAQLIASGGSTFEWSPATSISNPLSSKPFATPSQTTMYKVKVGSTEGCFAEDSIEVVVSAIGDASSFHIPSAFTPNSDGKNDCFGLRHWGNVQNFVLNIYNRWGELVFTTNNNSKCWDGRYKGQLQPGGVFVYHVKAKTMCGDVFKKGIITLIR